MTVNRISLIFLCLLLNVVVSRGQEVSFKASNFRTDKKGFKQAKQQIKEGDIFRKEGNDKVFNMQDGSSEFQKALFYYQKAYNFNSKSAELNYKIGNCLLFTNSKAKASEYINKAVNLSSGTEDVELPSELALFYGMCFQLDGRYEDAIYQYNLFKDNIKTKSYEYYKAIVEKYISECKAAPILLENPSKVWIDNLSLNSEYDDWSPCLSADGELLIFTSNRPNENLPNKVGSYDQEIYSVSRKGRGFNDVMPIDALNTTSDDVSGGLSYDGQRLLIFKQEEENTDVFESILLGTKWQMPKRKMGEKLKGPNTEQNETFASYDPPDVKVYYITDGGYNGNKNIYFSGVMNRERNLWGAGQSAGHEINTKFQEGSVYIHPDGKSMYFSSQGHNSIGGFDIFVSHVDELGHWGPPINLGYPINTSYDDLFYSATASGKNAYISSNRPGGKGGMDIYKVTYWGSKKPMSLDFEDQLMASIAEPVKDNTIAEPIELEEKSLTVFKGRVLDAITKEPVSADIVITINRTGKEYVNTSSNSFSGNFLLSLPSGSNYGIAVTAEGYLFHSENFDLPMDDGFNMVNKNIELKNINVGSNITLNNVFFDSNKYTLKDDSYAELDRLVNLMKDIKSLRIEISGHTDNIGVDVYNQTLSQKRADAVVSYLIQKGIEAGRLIAKGYGDSRPIETNESKEGRAANRRTAFEIIEN